jgi:hypothetical protein
VTVILSGNRPRQQVESEAVRHVGIDGRLADLNSNVSPHLIPLVSDNWRAHFRWNGTGPLPDAERQRLVDLVRQAHAQGRRIRFWAIPDVPTAWREMHRAGVDLINTDRLTDLRTFLTGPEVEE